MHHLMSSNFPSTRDLASLQRLKRRITDCRKCPRLVRWREQVAREKTNRYADWMYWGKPIPSFGDPKARLLIIGLAPAAHGGNRTGRMFTGDRSGDWLYRTLYKFGFSNKPMSLHRNDGLKLKDCYITATIRCVPPANKPLPLEIRNCRPYLLRELELLEHVKVIVGLGKVGFDAAVGSFQQLGWTAFDRKPKFSHGAEYALNGTVRLIASYHPSQQNTFTGKLTVRMFDGVFRRVRKILG